MLLHEQGHHFQIIFRLHNAGLAVVLQQIHVSHFMHEIHERRFHHATGTHGGSLEGYTSIFSLLDYWVTVTVKTIQDSTAAHERKNDASEAG